MTAPTYDTLTVDDTGADKILTTGTMQAVDQNPVSIAQRGTNAPLVQPPVREYKTSGSGATWTIPTGVTAFRMYVTGGGGGGSGLSGAASTAGGDSTATYNSVTYTGGGGSGGAVGLSGGAGGIGGTATNGDENNNGQAGCSGVGPQPVAPGGNSYFAGGKGCGGNGNSGGGGGAGGTSVVRIAVVSGQTTVTYTVGGAGSAGGTSGGNAGAGGVVIFEY